MTHTEHILPAAARFAARYPAREGELRALESPPSLPEGKEPAPKSILTNTVPIVMMCLSDADQPKLWQIRLQT